MADLTRIDRAKPIEVTNGIDTSAQVRTTLPGSSDGGLVIREAPLATLVFGQTTVTTAGTAVTLLGGAQTTGTITIKALDANAGNIYVGDSGVTSANGFILAAGEAVSIAHDHASDNIFIDSDNNGEGVSYIGST